MFCTGDWTIYGALGGLLAAFSAVECARAGVPAGPPFLRLRSPEPDATAAACGSASTGSDG